MRMTPLENLFLYRYARLIMDNRQELVSSAVSDKQRLLGVLFSSLQSGSTVFPDDTDNMTQQLRTQAQEMARLADRNMEIAGKLKESARILALIRNNLRRMEQIVTALRQGQVSFISIQGEFERLASENKQYLEQLASASRQIEQVKAGEKNISPAKKIELTFKASSLSDQEEAGKTIAEDLKKVLQIFESIMREQGQTEALAQELYFGADILQTTAGGGSFSSLNQEGTLSQAIEGSTGFIFNEKT